MKLHPVLLEMEEIRKEKGITRLMLAEMTGTTVATIGYWYNDGRNPGLYKVSECLGHLGYELCIRKKEKKK